MVTTQEEACCLWNWPKLVPSRRSTPACVSAATALLFASGHQQHIVFSNILENCQKLRFLLTRPFQTNCIQFLTLLLAECLLKSLQFKDLLLETLQTQKATRPFKTTLLCHTCLHIIGDPMWTLGANLKHYPRGIVISTSWAALYI